MTMNFLDFLFPRRCVSCGKLGGYFCRKCANSIHFFDEQICPICAKPSIDGRTHIKCQTSHTIDGLYSAVYFKDAIKDAIHQFKYQQISDLSEVLAKILVYKFPTHLIHFDFLCSVPLYRSREKERGFNQSFLLAKHMGRIWAIPGTDKLLVHTKKTVPQADLKKEDREKNVKDAFSLSRDINLTDRSIGLVDDVSTTRSTLVECAKILKRAHAKFVYGIVIAHGS